RSAWLYQLANLCRTKFIGQGSTAVRCSANIGGRNSPIWSVEVWQQWTGVRVSYRSPNPGGPWSRLLWRQRSIRVGNLVKVVLISGDGLPVSGLLTMFRNVLELGWAMGIIEGEVPADLGYSWRPDKKRFFPYGPALDQSPPWLKVSVNLSISHFDHNW